MPIYEYRCQGCDDQFEVMQKVGDRRLRTCKKCSGKLEKLISRTSFQLKGGGWFDSGYSAPSAKGSSSDSKASDGSDSSKKDSDSSKKDSGSSKKGSGSSGDGKKASGAG